jgi:hypothetical protein
VSKFTGANGRKPSTEARRYVYRVLAQTLEYDLANGSEWLTDAGGGDTLDEFDRRRVVAAAKKVIVEMRRKAER